MTHPKDYFELQRWLDNLMRDARDKLGIEDKDFEYLFLQRALELHLKTMTKG